MTHASDDDLVLHYYGETGTSAEIGRHLQTCADCARSYASLARTLSAVTAPPTPAIDDGFLMDVRDRATERLAARNRRLAFLVWLVPVLYPLCPAAIFYAAQLERTHGALGAPALVAALMWAFAGPFAALLALQGIQGSWTNRPAHRFIAYGALAATVSPALFNLMSRTDSVLVAWYVAIALVFAVGMLPVPQSAASTTKLRRIHRASGILILLFVAAHVANHLFAIVSVTTHAAVLDVLRTAYRQPIVEIVLLAAIAFQVGSGGIQVWRVQARRPSVATSVQMLSGAYLAVFFVAHVSAALLARPDTDTNFVWAAGRNGLLASRGLTLLLPYYLLGVVAFFAHFGQFLRIRLLRFMPVVSVRRLSYAGMAFGGAVVVTIGLALCGVHLLP